MNNYDKILGVPVTAQLYLAIKHAAERSGKSKSAFLREKLLAGLTPTATNDPNLTAALELEFDIIAKKDAALEVLRLKHAAAVDRLNKSRSECRGVDDTGFVNE